MIHFAEQACKLIRLEGGAAEITASPERTVVTIALTGRGEQGLQENDLLPVRQLGGVGEGVVIFFWGITSWSAGVDLRFTQGITIRFELLSFLELREIRAA